MSPQSSDNRHSAQKKRAASRRNKRRSPQFATPEVAVSPQVQEPVAPASEEVATPVYEAPLAAPPIEEAGQGYGFDPFQDEMPSDGDGLPGTGIPFEDTAFERDVEEHESARQDVPYEPEQMPSEPIGFESAAPGRSPEPDYAPASYEPPAFVQEPAWETPETSAAGFMADLSPETSSAYVPVSAYERGFGEPRDLREEGHAPVQAYVPEPMDFSHIDLGADEASAESTAFFDEEPSSEPWPAPDSEPLFQTPPEEYSHTPFAPAPTETAYADDEQAQETEELRQMIEIIRRDFDLTVLLIEHDMKFVMGICEEITVLEYGKIIAHGDPETVSNDPRVIAAYLGGDDD